MCVVSMLKKSLKLRIFSIRYAADDDAGFFRNTAGFSITDTAYSVRLKQIIGVLDNLRRKAASVAVVVNKKE
jgi:hypothetical protein